MDFSIHNNSLSVGNRVIDFEHQVLNGLINDIGQLMLVNHDVALLAAIRMLHDSLHRYFVVEERIAEAVGFDFAKHRSAHQKLFDNYRVITDKIISSAGKYSKFERKEFCDSLSDLLIQHIREDSKPLKIVLDTHLYDLKAVTS